MAQWDGRDWLREQERLDDPEVPTLGGPDEDTLIRRRVREPGSLVDGPSLLVALRERRAAEGRSS